MSPSLELTTDYSNIFFSINIKVITNSEQCFFYVPLHDKVFKS